MGNIGLDPWAPVVDQFSLSTRVLLRGPACSTSCPGPLGPMSEGPRGRPAIPGHSGPGPKTRGVNQLSRATCCWVRVPSGSTSSPGRIALVPSAPWGRLSVSDDSCLCPIARGLIRIPGRIAFVSEVPRGGPDVFGHSGPVPRDLRFDQVFWATRAHARGPTVSNRCPGRLWPSSEVLHVRPAVPATPAWVLRARGIDQVSRATRTLVQVPWVRPAVPGNLCYSRKTRGVDHLSWATLT